jgi:membrane protein implicated in regulation of membrane protease activity
MVMVYAICAAIGGTILICQFVMTLLGLGHGHGEFGGGDAHFELGHDAGHGDTGDTEAGHDAHGNHDADADHHVGSNWLFGVITFRTVVAALAFFGLAGLAGEQALWPPTQTLLLAVASGAAAMFVVHWTLQGLHRLQADGTVHIKAAVGRTGSVYLRVPGNRAGAGKVTVCLQGRSMEFQAMTTHEAIPTGNRVVVTGVLDRETLEVEPATAAVET